ncbi:MAG TPA: PqqD family peptide modification chaperone [Steroidobacter sp.]|jgi:pyrroloquinoline quinone biosynthesis protein D|nr:PqqD family peptide modification chaperone [Steroidobacteraceae bacterium]HLS82359.1 PqqD family peptide modification chaperone [Steroidobacter sp.]
MSTGRGRHRTVSNRRKKHAQRPALVRLAPGVRLDGGEDDNAAIVLVCSQGRVQLNSGAAGILRLCDGSRDRNGIVAELMRGSPRRALALEIQEFLEAAHARGWIVES